MAEHNREIANRTEIPAEIDGVKGYFYADSVTYIDDRAYISGSWVDDVGGDANEFIVEVSPESIPDVAGESLNDRRARLSDELVTEAFESQKHPPVLSTGDEFPNKSAMMRNISALEQVGVVPEAIPTFAGLAENDPDFATRFEGHLNNGLDADAALKASVLDNFDIRPDIRDKLIFESTSHEDFATKLHSRLSVDGTAMRSMMGRFSEGLSDLAKKAGPIGGAAIGALAAGAAAADEIQQGGTYSAAALVGGEVLHETANPYAETTTLVLQADFGAAHDAVLSESTSLALETAGFIAGAKIGASLGSFAGPGGAAVGGVVFGVGGAILGPVAMQELADSMGSIEVAPEQQIFLTYLNYLPDDPSDVPADAPEGMAVMANLKSQIMAAEEAMLTAQRQIPVDMMAVMEAEKLLDGTTGEVGLYEQYETAFFGMDPGLFDEHVEFARNELYEQFAEVGLDGTFSSPNGDTLDIVGVLGNPVALAALEGHLKETGNDTALEVLAEAKEFTAMSGAWSEFVATYKPEDGITPSEPANETTTPVVVAGTTADFAIPTNG